MARYIFLQYVDESRAPRPGSPELNAQIEAFASSVWVLASTELHVRTIGG